MASGIYIITSPSGGQYVGSAINIFKRWRAHISMINNQSHHNKALSRAAEKYGIDNLEFRCLLVCSPEHLIFYEQRAIDILKPRYNGRPKAENMLGYRHSEEANAKNGASKRGKKLSQDHRAKISAALKGHPSLIAAALGKKHSPETIEKRSAKARGRKLASSFEQAATFDQRSQLAADYAAGMGFIALERKYGASHQALRRMIVAQGMEIRKRTLPPVILARKITLEEIRRRQATRMRNAEDRGFYCSPRTLFALQTNAIGRKKTQEEISKRNTSRATNREKKGSS